jgi:hypothetical protein
MTDDQPIVCNSRWDHWITAPWFVGLLDFWAAATVIQVDFVPGTRFAHPRALPSSATACADCLRTVMNRIKSDLFVGRFLSWRGMLAVHRLPPPCRLRRFQTIVVLGVHRQQVSLVGDGDRTRRGGLVGGLAMFMAQFAPVTPRFRSL